MDLRDSTKQQTEALIDWLRKRFNEAEPPSPAVWEELCREAHERGQFTEAFILPKLEEPTRHLPGLQVIRGTGAGEALVHPRERIAVFQARNGSEEPEPVQAEP